MTITTDQLRSLADLLNSRRAEWNGRLEPLNLGEVRDIHDAVSEWWERDDPAFEPPEPNEAHGFYVSGNSAPPPFVPEPDSLESVLHDVTEWQIAQFPHRSAHSIATHLLEEARELHREPTDAEEMADVAMLLAGLAHFNGVDLAEVVRAKLAKNKARTWGKPDENGVVKHVGTPEPDSLDATTGIADPYGTGLDGCDVPATEGASLAQFWRNLDEAMSEDDAPPKSVEKLTSGIPPLSAEFVHAQRAPAANLVAPLIPRRRRLSRPELRELEQRQSEVEGRHTPRGTYIPTEQELIAEIRRQAMGGVMPTVKAFDKARPATWAAAQAHTFRLKITWNELAQLAELKPNPSHSNNTEPVDAV